MLHPSHDVPHRINIPATVRLMLFSPVDGSTPFSAPLFFSPVFMSSDLSNNCRAFSLSYRRHPPCRRRIPTAACITTRQLRVLLPASDPIRR